MYSGTSLPRLPIGLDKSELSGEVRVLQGLTFHPFSIMETNLGLSMGAIGAIQVLRNAVGGGREQDFLKKSVTKIYG